MSCEGREFSLDASVLITFSKNGQYGLLEEALAGRGVVSDEVYGECVSPRIWLDVSIATGKFRRIRITTPADLAFFAQARRQMDLGEASALTIARSIGATLLCDDGDAIRVGPTLQEPWPLREGSADVLCYAVSHGVLTPTQAEAHLEAFIAGGAFIPDVAPGFFGDCASMPMGT